MSGQLVGEVLDACEAGLTLTPQERLLLIAIAEKCQQSDRRGFVRKARLVAAVGQSQRTTERYLKALADRGLVVVVRRGFNSHGKQQATLYELPPIMVAEAKTHVLPPAMVAEASGGASATLVGGTETPCASAKSEGASAKSARASATPPTLTSDDKTLDGTNDGTFDGKKKTTLVPRVVKDKERTKPPAAQPVAPRDPLRQAATGDNGQRRPIDPAFVDAVVHVLRANRELTIDQIEYALRDHPNPTISAQSTRIALDGLRAAESDGRAARTGRREQNWALSSSGRAADWTYEALNTEHWQRAS